MLYLGTSGWYYDDWQGVFYPDDIQKSDWLPFYSTQFNTVEVNASFYRLPFKNMMKGWMKKTPNDFLLTFKGSQVITHRKKLHDVKEYLEKFFDRMFLAKRKIGVILWQLPPQVKKDVALLEDFINILDSDFRHCIEFRHKSWFQGDVYSALERYNIGFCVLSAPKLPSIIKVTSDFAYFRWHGKKQWYKYNYTKKELNGWATQLKKLDVDIVFGYFNNDYKGYAPKNCIELKEIME
jgi:uncharacterized protein YecE (DUF72 family)